MNEKYQQALEGLWETLHTENHSISDADNYYKTLQELVDMMKPLEFEELEVGMEIFDSEKGQVLTIDKFVGEDIYCKEWDHLDDWNIIVGYFPDRFYPVPISGR